MIMKLLSSQVGKFLLFISVSVQGLLLNRVYRELFGTYLAHAEHEDAPIDQRLQLSLIHLDIMVPVFDRDDRLRLFARDLGEAIRDYQANTVYTKDSHHHKLILDRPSDIPHISTFRLLVTRFSDEEKATATTLQQELSQLTHLAESNIVMVHAPPGQAFSRAVALNLLHDAACHARNCLATRLDVDMQLKAEFFSHAVETVWLQREPPLDEHNGPWHSSLQNTSLSNDDRPVAYFPIVWSAYNPQSIQLVQQHLNLSMSLPQYSEHVGHWRPYGKGMYVIRGADCLQLKYDTSFEGWGGEDVDFYNRTVAAGRRIFRRVEPGLIHVWHAKDCELVTPEQQKNCLSSLRREQGSELGQSLLKAYNEQLREKQKLQQQQRQKRRAGSGSSNRLVKQRAVPPRKQTPIAAATTSNANRNTKPTTFRLNEETPTIEIQEKNAHGTTSTRIHSPNQQQQQPSEPASDPPSETLLLPLKFPKDREGNNGASMHKVKIRRLDHV